MVRHFSSADPAPGPDLAKIATAPEWIVTPAPPSAAAGQHRFVWDFHYPVAAPLADQPRAAGVWAPPGQYTVVLTVDGTTFRQPLDLLADPRVKASPASYRREFDLARRVEADLARVATAIGELGKARADLAKAATPASAALNVRAAALANPRNADGLAALAERLAGLEAAVDGADGGPSPDAEAGYAATARTLEATLATWTALKVEMTAAKV
jgi:hypothetical protein